MTPSKGESDDSQEGIDRDSNNEISLEIKSYQLKGIKTSIYQRNKLYNLFLRAKELKHKNEFHCKYKIYRNKIVDLLRNSKTNHYKNFFLSNITNSKNTWTGIKQLINNKKSTTPNIDLNIKESLECNPKTVAYHINSHLTSVADKIRAKFPTSNTTFNNFLKYRNSNAFFSSPSVVLRYIKS